MQARPFFKDSYQKRNTVIIKSYRCPSRHPEITGRDKGLDLQPNPKHLEDAQKGISLKGFSPPGGRYPASRRRRFHSSSQSGFLRPLKSCKDALFHLQNKARYLQDVQALSVLQLCPLLLRGQQEKLPCLLSLHTA